MPSNDIILIVGVGRSGTSALTRVLSFCGCTLPRSVLKAAWEPIDVWKLNHQFMLRHGTEYTDPSMRLQELILDDREKEDYISKIQAHLSGFCSGSVPVIKQPDITEVMDLWVQAARRSGVSMKVVIPIRHPQEVLASIAAAGGPLATTSVELVNAFWLKRNLLAERHSRNFPRVFVEYSNLLDDWRTEVARVSTALSIDLRPDEMAIDGFLTSNLHRCSNPVTETFAYSWITRVYEVLSSAARDGTIDLPIMDEIYHAYCVSERTFRIARDEFCAMFNRINPQQIDEALERAPVLRSDQNYE